MRQKGTALIKSSIKMEDCIVGGYMTEKEFLSQTKGKLVNVQDIAVNKSGCLILINNPCALVDIPRKHIAAVYPFYKDSDGYLMCSEFSEIQNIFWKTKLISECPSGDPLQQVALFYKEHPEFWERETEFIWV
jgi:hypothetical protein